MSGTQARSDSTTSSPGAPAIDMKLEVIVLPVSDVGRAAKRISAADPDWSDWCAAYMAAEQAGHALPT